MLLLPLALVYVLSFAAFRAPKSPPVVWCLHRFDTCTSCLVVGKSSRMCVYVCARSHTIITCVRTSSSAERQAGQPEVSIALSKHGRAQSQVAMECTTSACGLFLRLCDRGEEQVSTNRDHVPVHTCMHLSAVSRCSSHRVGHHWSVRAASPTIRFDIHHCTCPRPVIEG